MLHRFAFNVSVRDAGVPPLTSIFAVNITVTDVNEAPSAIALNTSTFPEDLAVGLAIASMSVVDPDRGQTHSCTLGDPSQTFVLGPDHIIRLATATIDYERRAL